MESVHGLISLRLLGTSIGTIQKHNIKSQLDVLVVDLKEAIFDKSENSSSTETTSLKIFMLKTTLRGLDLQFFSLIILTYLGH